MPGIKKNRKICLIASSPVTLWNFYRDLISELGKSDYRVTVVASAMRELPMMKQYLNCEAFSVGIRRQISPLRDLFSIFCLWWYFLKKKQDIVHAHTPKGGLIGMISSFLARVPYRVYTIHGLPLDTAKGLKREILSLAEWLSCKLATEVLAVSPSLKTRILDEKICIPNKIRVLGNGSACGINLNKFSLNKDLIIEAKRIRAKYEIGEEAFVIGFVGRVVPDKGIEALVKAFKKFNEDFPDSYLMLIGEFETVRETINQETLNAIESDDHIVFNNKFEDNIVPFYGAMDILTLPTRREGFGLTLVEAAVMKLPTIATRVTGCVDAVEENVSGLLVTVDNPEELCAAMLSMAKNLDMRKKMGKHGCERAKRLFDSKLLIKEHMKLYSNLTR